MKEINTLDLPFKKLLSPTIAKVFSSEKTVLLVIILTTCLAVLLGAFSENRKLYNGDEEIYLRVINLFKNDLSLELLRSYQGEPASPAPLFFIIYAWWGKLFGFSYPIFCGLSLIITLLTMLCLIVFIYKQSLQEHRNFFPLLVFLFPYIFVPAFSVMAEPLTLLFTVLGLCCYMYGLNRQSNLALLLGSIAVTAALYVRIFAVFAVVALMVVLLLQKERSVLKWSLALTPILARLPLVFVQGGFTVSREAFQGTMPEFGFVLSNINFSFVWFGCFFFPLLWWCSRSNYWINLTATLILIPFYIFNTPNFLSFEHAGILRSLLVQLQLNATLAQWLLFPVWFLGCYMTINLIQRIVIAQNLREVFLGSCIVLFMASLVFSSVVFERYYQLIVPAVVLIGVTKTSQRSGYVAMIVIHIFYLILSFSSFYKLIK